MKFLNDVLDNYNEIYRVMIDDRFGIRLCQFLTIDQMQRIGYKINEKHCATHQPKEWNEENILKQLKEDVQFGYEKAVNNRSISSALMYMVVLNWCKILENEFADWDINNYGDNGKNLFLKVAKKYHWLLKAKKKRYKTLEGQ